eukprot:28044-Eustigmatos_ZCMA.PRE.1
MYFTDIGRNMGINYPELQHEFLDDSSSDGSALSISSLVEDSEGTSQRGVAHSIGLRPPRAWSAVAPDLLSLSPPSSVSQLLSQLLLPHSQSLPHNQSSPPFKT